MIGGELVVRIRNDLSELERIAGVIEQFGVEHGLPSKAVFEINLALDEVLTNVISYAYADGGPHEIEVRLSIPDETRTSTGWSGGSNEPSLERDEVTALAQVHWQEVTVEVSDDGRPFDPLTVAPADLDQALEERSIGGLGVHFVRRVMDRLEYRRDAGRNVLTMHKRARAA